MELYIHIPFCVKKCAYCDFLSAPATPQVRKQYVERLLEEIAFYGTGYRKQLAEVFFDVNQDLKPSTRTFRDGKHDAEQSAETSVDGVCKLNHSTGMLYADACLAETPVDTVFFGGGTPTILEGEQLVALMDGLRKNFRISPDAEITIECNPGTLDEKKARALVNAGFNRISLGLQSTDNRELKMLGRIHTFEQFLESYEMARKGGFHNINVDLMSALPGQTVDSWEKTSRTVSTLSPEHISAYSLIIEEGTPFYEKYHADEERRGRGDCPDELPTEEEEREMYKLTSRLLKEYGYERYEISNYAKPGFACRHNIGYWTRQEYLGLGLGASSFVDACRFQNISDLQTYLQQPFSHQNVQAIVRKAAMEEFMFLGLRLMNGVSSSEFERQFGVPMKQIYGNVLDRLKAQKLIFLLKDRVALTEYGIDVSNYVLAQFLLE